MPTAYYNEYYEYYYYHNQAIEYQILTFLRYFLRKADCLFFYISNLFVYSHI